MNRRKLQIFVSSTFNDLKEERQAAVEAILKAGHIPAGMELFTAGSTSQLEVIKKWISESDAYLLLLGARYGSIDPKSGLSYTEVEFEYARELQLPFFAVVLSDEGRAAKVRDQGEKVLERDNVPKYDAFRGKVCSQLCSFFETSKDIKLAILEALPQIAADPKLIGWIPASDAGPSNKLAEELTSLMDENRQLKAQLAALSSAVERATSTDGRFRRMAALLDDEVMDVPDELASDKLKRVTALLAAVTFSGKLALGVANRADMSETEKFLYFDLAPKLAAFGLMERDKTPPSVRWSRLKTSKQGVELLVWTRENYDFKRKTREINGIVGDASPIAVEPDAASATKTAHKRPKTRQTSSR